MTNRLSPANLVARSAAFARTLAQRNPRLSPFRQRRGGVMSALKPASLLLAALALLAIPGALFVPDRAQAQAQVLVSNLEQTSTASSALRNGNRRGQTFSIAPTGGASYYTLSSIEIPFARNGIAATDMGLLTVSLWSTHASGANAGRPKNRLSTLTNPESAAADATATFAAPADLTLAAGRTYAVVVVYSKNIDAADIGDAPYWQIVGTGEDADPATGWSIVDSSHASAAGSASWGEVENEARYIRVNGTAVQAQVLVSNLEQTSTASSALRNGNRRGQTFSIATTGGASYYTLSSIEIPFARNGIAATDMGSLTVSLWSTHASGANAGQPDSLLSTLTNPESAAADATATFAAPADLTLAAGRTYAVVVVYSKTIDAADIGDAPYWQIVGTGEDADPATGWSIVDSSHASAAGSASWGEVENEAQKIRVNGNETINNDPVFASTAETREVAENSAAGTDVGAVIPAATDADDDTLTYAMEGDDEASFDFDASTRQITTKTGVTYNYEATKNTYSVTVTADDGNDSTATVAVTINLTDVSEKSAKPAKPTLAAVTGTPTSLTASWRKPGLNGGPEITGYNVQYKLSSASMWSDFTHSGTEVTATITGLTAGMSYQVRVQAKNGETDSDWSDASDAQNTTPTPTSDATITSLLSRMDVELRETAQHTSTYTSHAAGYDVPESKGTLSPAGFNYPAGFGHWYRVEELVSSQEGAQGSVVSTGLHLNIHGTVTSVASSGNHPAHVLPAGADITLRLEGDNWTRSYSLDDATRVVDQCSNKDSTMRHCRVGETTIEEYNWNTNLPPVLDNDDSVLVRLQYSAPRPGKPGTLTVTAPTGKSGALIVEWYAPASDDPKVRGYEVHLSPADGETGASGVTRTTGGSTLRLPVLLLDPDTAYNVRVRARTYFASGPWSDTATATTNALQGSNNPQVTLDLNDITKVKVGDKLYMRLKVTGMNNLHAGAFSSDHHHDVEFRVLGGIHDSYVYEDLTRGYGEGAFYAGALTIGEDGEVYHNFGYDVIAEGPVDGDGAPEYGPLYLWLERTTGVVQIGSTANSRATALCVEIADDSNTVPTGRTCSTNGSAGHAVDRLTGRFVNVPQSHDGESEFTVRLAFVKDVGISPDSLREDALAATGGAVTRVQRVDDRSDLFEITVEPESDEDVTITLSSSGDCGEAGSICTQEEDPRKLYNSPTATVAGPILTASFQGLPSQHDGETAFSFRIAFSDEIATDAAEFRDHSVEVWGGEVTRAEPVGQRRDLWEVEVEPASEDMVMVSLKLTQSCAATGAVCTAGGRLLSVVPATMVPGPATWPVRVTGEARVGKTLTADSSNLSERYGVQVTSMTYRWLADGARIPGANARTYQPDDDKQGKRISVMATYTDDRGNEDTVISAPTEPLAARDRIRRATGLPLISGRALVGHTLTADKSLIIDPNGLENAVFHYFWEADDDSIPDATGTTYTPVEADVGKEITVIVAWVDDAGHGQNMTSQPTMPVTTEEAAAAVEFRKSLRVAANADGSVTLYWNAPDEDVTGYRILRHRHSLGELDPLVYVADTGSTATAYTDTGMVAGVPHNYRVQAIRDGVLGERTIQIKIFPVRKATNSPATGAPAISGTAQVGETLTADISGIADEDGLENVTKDYLWAAIGSSGIIGSKYAYQWLADGAESGTGDHHAGYNNTTYTLAEDDEGKAMSVRMTFVDDGGHQETLTSAATDPVAPLPQPNSPARGAPTIGGAAQVGETLTVDTSGITDEDGLDDSTFTHQWVREDSVMVASAARSYTPTGGDRGKAIKVRVSFTDDAGNRETRTSTQTAPIEGQANGQEGNSPATGAPVISGTAQVGQTLTADITGIADADGLSGETFTYQWVSNDGTTDTDIENATGSTYKLVDGDQGKAIRVRVTFTDDGGNEETLTSAPTGPVWGNGPPGAPRNLAAAPGNKEVTLSWDPPADNGNAPATGYRIEWRADGKDYDKTIWGTARSTTYTTNDNANLANGVKYFFRVKAGNGSGNSQGPYGPASGEVSASPTSGSAVDLGTPVLSDTETLHHGMARLDWEDVEDASWYVVQYYHLEGGEWLDLPAEGVDVAFHGSSAVVSNLHGLSWLRVGAANCDGTSEWSQIEELYGTKESDWEGVPVPEVAEGDETKPCPVVLGTPVLSDTETLHHGMVRLDWEDIEDAGWYVVQHYHVEGGEWLDLPAVGVEIAFHGSSAVVSNLHGLSWLRVRAVSCAGESEWSQIEQLFGTNASDWEDVPVPEVAEGDVIEPCSEDADTPDNSPATGAPTISGTVQVGETLTADTSGIADADGLGNVQYQYQWLADDAEIAGATSPTYTLAAADEGKAISVQVGFTDDADNEETLTSAATDAVAAAPTPNSPATGAPAISGTAQVGETLTADTSGIADDDGLNNVQYEYQWLADDSEIAGATSLTYTLADADEGKAIKVEVSFTDDAGNDETLTSPATDAVVAEPLEPPAKPTGLTGTASHDSVTLTWDDPQDESITGYAILRRIPGVDPDGQFRELVADTGTTATTYTDDTVTSETRYTYRIKAINGAGTSERSRWFHIDTPASPAPEPANSPATGVPTISGTAQVGETLTANTSGIADADGLGNVRYEYQWLADDADISGATNATYTLAAADEGKAVKVEVSFTDDAGNDESLTSAATEAVAAAEPAEPPAKPRNLSATASHDSVTLTWDDPQDDSITGYVVLRRIPGVDPDGQFSELVADTGSAATTYTDDTVAASTTYTYRIKAINGAGTSERSRWIHIDIPAAPVPDKPTGLSATAAHDSVTLTWNDPGDDSITGYVVLRRNRDDDPKGHFDELVADTGTAAATYTDDTVAAGTSYTYRIKAINEHGTSERSRWFHIDTPAAP